MRGLLAQAPGIAVSPAVSPTPGAVNLAVVFVSAAVLVPAIILCGICMGSRTAQRPQEIHEPQYPTVSTGMPPAQPDTAHASQQCASSGVAL